MRKIVSFMHVSLDGYVTDSSGGMDWIVIDDSIFDYASDRTHQADIALYGRNTFAMMEGYWPTAADKPNASKHDREHSAWYKQVKKVVLSTTSQPAGAQQVIGANAGAALRELKKSGDQEIIIFGSPGVVHSLTREQLIDEFWLFVSPVILGGGKPMFPSLADRTNLILRHSKVFDCGVVCMHYSRA